MAKEKTNDDHDLLIRLDEKLEQVIKDIKTLSEGVYTKVENIDNRLNAVERIVNDDDYRELVSSVKANTGFRKQFKLTWKLVLAVVGFSTLILGLVIGSLNIFDFLT